MSAQLLARDQLGELDRIGQGGQGVVYRAPKVTTAFSAAMVYKEYRDTLRTEIDFTALAAMPALVEDTLTYAQAERLISIAAWPCRLVEDGGAPTGFVMPVIPEDFFIPLTTVKGTNTVAAEFQHLLNHSSVLAARGITLSDAGRYGLLRELALELAFLHSHGVCIGDISPKNLLFSLTPHPAVYLIDCDAMRINGVSALPQVETPGWEVPAGEELATVYSDTYKLGLLALRLLAGDQHSISPAHLPAHTPDLLRQLITDTLTNAADRRPLPQAWSYVLGHAVEIAQHQKDAAPQVSPAPTPPPQPVVHSRPTTTASPRAATASRPPVTAPAFQGSNATPQPPRARAASSALRRVSPLVAALAAAALIIVAAIVAIAIVVNHNGGTTQAVPTESPARPSDSVTGAAPPLDSATYTAPAAAPSPAVPPPLPGPDPSALAPFAREWHGMKERIQIDATGHGSFHYMAPCPSCTTMAEMPYYTLEFALTSVSGPTATGTVMTSPDPKYSVGESVKATLGQTAGTDTIEWSIGNQYMGLFCGPDSSYCGG